MSKVILRDLSKSFGDVNVIRDVNLEIGDGEFVSFLGPSGCGKTTTLRMVAGFDMPSAGDIYIGDKLVSSVKNKVFIPTEERNIGVVFQNYAVWPHMDVFANVAYPLKIQKVKKREMTERVMNTLRLVKLEGLEKRMPHQLSGGQQQRVALARALVMEPDVMLLDEPLSNLDAKLREDMRFEIKDIQRRTGVTIIYVTHDQAEAMAMSDRIMLLHDSKIQQIGAPRELYEQPANEFVADFIGLINFLEVEIIEVVEDEESEIRRARFNCNPEATINTRYSGNVGDRCVIGIRPEDIELTRKGEEDLTGIVAEKVYLGNNIDYRVQFGQQVIRIELPAHIEFAINEQVGIKFTRHVIFSK